jgi:hypothetical protein
MSAVIAEMLFTIPLCNLVLDAGAGESGRKEEEEEVDRGGHIQKITSLSLLQEIKE